MFSWTRPVPTCKLVLIGKVIRSWNFTTYSLSIAQAPQTGATISHRPFLAGLVLCETPSIKGDWFNQVQRACAVWSWAVRHCLLLYKLGGLVSSAL